MKTCSKCKKTKPITEFNKDRRASDGRRSECKDCSRNYLKGWRRHNPEYMRNYLPKWRAKNPEKQRAYKQAYYRKHRTEALAYAKRERASDPEKVRERHRKHFLNNREYYRQKERRYRARKNEVKIDSSVNEHWEQVLEAYEHRCAYCGKLADPITMDHIIPISRGGYHTIYNVIPACGRCNSCKGDRTPKEAGLKLILYIPVTLILSGRKFKLRSSFKT